MGTALPVEMRLFQTDPEPTKSCFLIEEKLNAQCYKAQNDNDEDKRRDVPSYLLCFLLYIRRNFFLPFPFFFEEIGLFVYFFIVKILFFVLIEERARNPLLFKIVCYTIFPV